MWKLRQAYKNPDLSWSFNDTKTDRMMDFSNFVHMINRDFPILDRSPYFDIHFMSYDSLCHLCDLPYKYIIRLETFAEDYQFLMRKAGLWQKFNRKHKLVGQVKGRLLLTDEFGVVYDWKRYGS